MAVRSKGHLALLCVVREKFPRYEALGYICEEISLWELIVLARKNEGNNYLEYRKGFLSRYHYDIAIPKAFLVFEFDGEFHYKPNNMEGENAIVSMNTRVMLDRFKDSIAREAGYRVYRFRNINKIKQELGELI